MAQFLRSCSPVKHADSEDGQRRAAAILRARRDVILQNWIARVGQQPFHLGRPERAVADHIPILLDALIEHLDAGQDEEPETAAAAAAWRGPAIQHAEARFLQGLSSGEVVTELRMLLQLAGEELAAAEQEQGPSQPPVAEAQVAIANLLFAVAAVSSEALDGRLRQQRSEAAGLVAHDLRTPLTSLRGFAELLSRTPESPRVAEASATILAQTDRVLEIIDRFLAGVSASPNVSEIRPAVFDLRDLLPELVEQMGDEGRGRIRVALPEDQSLEGFWDRMQLQRAFQNILANALKYAPEGDIKLTVDGDPERLRIRVQDVGIGISQVDQSRVLEPHYRSREAIERNIEGTGLGLYIARGIVEAHRGEILIESPGPGRGTTVTVTLPRMLRGQHLAGASDS